MYVRSPLRSLLYGYPSPLCRSIFCNTSFNKLLCIAYETLWTLLMLANTNSSLPPHPVPALHLSLFSQSQPCGHTALSMDPQVRVPLSKLRLLCGSSLQSCCCKTHLLSRRYGIDHSVFGLACRAPSACKHTSKVTNWCILLQNNFCKQNTDACPRHMDTRIIY